MKLVLIVLLSTNLFPYRKCDNLLDFQLNLSNTTNVSFNEILGYASTNVPAYSNGNDSYIAYEYYYLYGVFMGMKWQCVEFARRWLFIRKGCVFGHNKAAAADLWTRVDYVQRVVDGKCYKVKKYPNGSPVPPQNESLLIYPRSGVDMPYGHIAVIVDVLPNFIRVAEENYYFFYWSRNYSRQIPYVFKNGRYFIEDEDPILGWMSIENNNETQPLDQQTVDKIIQLNTRTARDFICPNNSVNYRFPFYTYLFSISFIIFIKF